jgi:putative CRISPR-associated protein (TIGR02619 family)
MTTIFLSPCGTSLLTNKAIYQESSDQTEFDHFVVLRDSDKMSNFIRKTANFDADTIKRQYPEEFLEFKKFIENRQARLLNDDTSLQEVCLMSAELNTLITYYDHVLPKNTGDQHYLLCTDTYQGQATANMVKAWLEKNQMITEVKVCRDLNTNSLENFHIAMVELISWCDEILQPWRNNSKNHIIFNLTGGFKSVQGFLQTIGMFYADEILYIFQSSKELLRIPRLPITLDGQAKQIVEENLNIFRLLAMGKQLPVNQCTNIPGTLLFPLGEEVVLSTWGNLIWKQVQSDFYQKELLPPLIPRLVYSKEFEKNVKDLKGDRLETLNKRLDDLSRHLDDQNYNPRSLDFKKLKGKPMKDSTHELDVWSDQGKRIYGHFEGDKFMIDQLGEHL